jgi:hypothetical protein
MTNYAGTGITVVIAGIYLRQFELCHGCPAVENLVELPALLKISIRKVDEWNRFLLCSLL